MPEDEENSAPDDSDYVPETNSSDESGDENHSLKDRTNQSKNSNNDSINITAHSFSQAVNVEGHSAPDDGNLVVASVESGHKRDYCCYCNKEQAKLSRHLIRQHKFEEDVAELLSFPKRSTERKHMMSVIRKKGHFLFNTSEALNTGERKVVRRPNARYKKTATDFATCPGCLGDYAKTSIRHHVRRCMKNRKKDRRNIMTGSKAMAGRIHRIASNVLRQRVFPTLQEDDIVRIIRYDHLIILFGNKLCRKYKDPHHYDMIRQKLRQLGRLLTETRKQSSEVSDFFSIYYPKNYDSVILAIQSLAGLNETQTGFKTPSIATSMGTLLKQVGKLCVSEYIKQQDKEKQIFAEDFLKLLTEDYGASIARTALETCSREKRRKKTILPSKEDIAKLQIYLRDKVNINFNILEDGFSYQAWMDLASAVLVSLQLFNRRRPGETERILIEDYRSHEKIGHHNIGEGYEKFSAEEKKTAASYVRFTLRGKLNRTVSVLVHEDLRRCIDSLLVYRKQAKVDPKNPYLFGIPGTLKGDFKYLRACEWMRRYAEECGASNPQSLRGTILRKHVATMCVNFNLSDGEIAELANFMGHSKDIHKNHYRQPIIVREILNMTKLLETVQGRPNLSDSSDSDEEQNQNLIQERGCNDENVDDVTGEDGQHVDNSGNSGFGDKSSSEISKNKRKTRSSKFKKSL